MRVMLFVLLFAVTDAIAQKIDARIDCKSAGAALVYDCTIRLTRGAQPLSGVQVSMGADMPSMPMAHNVKPVMAKPGRQPGEYQARLALEMQGEWTVKLRLSGPVRDQIVKTMRFD